MWERVRRVAGGNRFGRRLSLWEIFSRRFLRSLSAVCLLASPAVASPDAAPEVAASALFERMVGQPARLRVFLQAMPKGADLHNHLSGTAYAEDYLAWAAQAGFCFDPVQSRLIAPPCPPEQAMKGMGARNPFGYAELIDALSTRGYQRGIGRNEVSGHTQFFSTFGKFGAIASATPGEAIAAAKRLAAGDHVSYLELINNPESLNALAAAGDDAPLDETGFARAFARERAAVPQFLRSARGEIDAAEARASEILGCAGASPDPACAIKARYLAYAGRSMPPAKVFRGLVLAFALADADERFAGVNIVAPEDWTVSLADYDLHMAMFRFLASRYPRVRTTLHAGELTLGIVSPAALRDHIRKAVEIAGARRIGHGTDIAFEAGAADTLARMARERVAVEINLTSNDVILGVKGADHPLALYRAAGVPVVLSTDDMGILRTDMTNEYVRAATEHGLRYRDLKALARASLEYAFLPGESLWKEGEVGTPVAPCARREPARACEAFLQANEKARVQSQLEASLLRFEQDVITWRF
jgi:adenosine deaminase